MRVLQINNFEFLNGGSDRVYQMTTKMLLDKGHEVATVSCGECSFDDRKISIIMEKNKYFSGGIFSALNNAISYIYRRDVLRYLTRLLDNFLPDVVHLHIFYGQISSSVLKFFHDKNIPCVMTVHEYRLICPTSLLYRPGVGVCNDCAVGSKINVIKNKCNKNSYLASGLSFLEVSVRDIFFAHEKYIKHFFMVSEFCRNKHKEYKVDIYNKSSVLYNFIEDGRVADVPVNVAQGASYLYFGRLSPEKGVELMCEAFALRPELRLRIAGDGPIAGKVIEKYSKFDNINFLGRLDQNELKKELSSAWFSMVPSECFENNPMSVLESFSVGVPVLGANIGGIPELVFDGCTGYIFESANIESMLNAIDKSFEMSESDRMLMAKKSLDLIKRQHSERNYYEKLIGKYEEVVGG